MGHIKSREVMKSLTRPNVRDRLNTANLIDKLVTDIQIKKVLNKDVGKKKKTSQKTTNVPYRGDVYQREEIEGDVPLSERVKVKLTDILGDIQNMVKAGGYIEGDLRKLVRNLGEALKQGQKDEEAFRTPQSESEEVNEEEERWNALFSR